MNCKEDNLRLKKSWYPISLVNCGSLFNMNKLALIKFEVWLANRIDKSEIILGQNITKEVRIKSTVSLSPMMASTVQAVIFYNSFNSNDTTW